MIGRSHDVASAVAREYLRLKSAQDVGPIIARRLVSHFGSIERVFAQSKAGLEEIEGVGRHRSEAILLARSSDEWERELELSAKHGVRLICWEDAEYPKMLLQTPDPPICLYVRGSVEPEDAASMAIVGSRRCTRYGAEQAESFGASLAYAGFTIVSGMARGVDTAAHRGALSVNGRTIAILGCGLGHIYPDEHLELAEEIAARGAVLSELPFDVAPDAKNFIPRNRVIAGMSLGVLVAECAKRSGALSTARFASEYNREVFAIPGLITNALAHGTNALIRESQAKLVMSAQDIFDELGLVGMAATEDAVANQPDGQECLPGIADTAPEVAAIPLDENEQAIMTVLSRGEVSLEVVCDESGCAAAVVAATLTRLQMKGMVTQKPGNMFSSRR
jgi:DNA processing protein